MQARQGDLFFATVENKRDTSKMKPHPSPILAYGEATGHTHRIISPSMEELDSWVDSNGDIIICNPNGPIEVAHDEHGTITLPQGEQICISRQREYDPVAAMRERQVRD